MRTGPREILAEAPQDVAEDIPKVEGIVGVAAKVLEVMSPF